MVQPSAFHIQFPDRLYIDGEWVPPASAETIDVVDSHDENVVLRVAQASDADVERAVGAARKAFDDGPWPTLSHLERADYLRALATELEKRHGDLTDLWPRESGILHRQAVAGNPRSVWVVNFYADLASTFPWEERVSPTSGGEFGLIVREPVGVVGAIIPWNGPLATAVQKLAPALLAGCTTILKAAPEAPGAAYILAECADAAGLPPGVLNVLTADRETSEALVRDPRVDKIAFTGSTAAGRRIASLMGARIGRCTLELGGKSAAIILDDADLDAVASSITGSECMLTGQVCASLTRLLVSKHRHDEFVDVLAHKFSAVHVGDPFDEASDMGPLASARQRDRVESYIHKGLREGATLAAGGGRPKDLERGFYVEPTVFADVHNASAIAQEEIFGPVLTVIPFGDEHEAITIANDSIYGLNSSVFTQDIDRARAIASKLRTGTVGHNAYRTDLGIGFGGFKQSGIGREGGRDGVLSYLESKTVILDGAPSSY